MMSDKLKVVCSNKIFRRIKDLYDIYVLSIIYEYDMARLIKVIKEKHSDIDINEFKLTEDNVKELRHAYNKYEGFPINIKFEKVYGRCLNFLGRI